MNTPIPGTTVGIRYLIPSWLRPLYHAMMWLAGIITVFVFVVIVGVAVFDSTPLTVEFLRAVFRDARFIGFRIAAHYVAPFAPVFIMWGLWRSDSSESHQSTNDDRTEVTSTGIVRHRNENGYIIHPGRNDD